MLSSLMFFLNQSFVDFDKRKERSWTDTTCPSILFLAFQRPLSDIIVNSLQRWCQCLHFIWILYWLQLLMHNFFQGFFRPIIDPIYCATFCQRREVSDPICKLIVWRIHDHDDMKFVPDSWDILWESTNMGTTISSAGFINPIKLFLIIDIVKLFTIEHIVYIFQHFFIVKLIITDEQTKRLVLKSNFHQDILEIIAPCTQVISFIIIYFEKRKSNKFWSHSWYTSSSKTLRSQEKSISSWLIDSSSNSSHMLNYIIKHDHILLSFWDLNFLQFFSKSLQICNLFVSIFCGFFKHDAIRAHNFLFFKSKFWEETIQKILEESPIFLTWKSIMINSHIFIKP